MAGAPLGDGSEVLMGGGAGDLGPLGFGADSAYQNMSVVDQPSPRWF